MYTALYRKKRPTTFSNVVDQKSIVITLTNQLKSGHISHAYLFCGTRGTGKTSTAKIFARAVNCPNRTGAGEPCNTCDSCKDILAERSLNVIEIDAASNNGVDNIRDLREEVKYPPAMGMYKVYIIDEVHMLTTAAFNALLKTLEEPPEHVIFILATTDPQKLPATILSRCQRYDFKRITRAGIVNTLASYMEADNISIETDALEYIASVSDGAMRDALSILDQCLALYAGEPITLAKVQSLLGAVDLSSLFDYSEALSKKDTNTALTIIAKAVKEGRDLSRFTSDIIRHFRNLLVASQISDHTDILDYSQETIDRYRKSGAVVEPDTLINYIKEFSELQNQLRYTTQERLILEVFTVKLCGTSPSIKHMVEPPPPAPPAITPVISEPPSSPSPASSNIADDWSGFCSTLSGLLKPMLSLCKAEEAGDGITILCKDQASLQYLKDQKEAIVSELVKYFKLPEGQLIVFALNEGYNVQSENSDSFKESIRGQISMPVEFD